MLSGTKLIASSTDTVLNISFITYFAQNEYLNGLQNYKQHSDV